MDKTEQLRKIKDEVAALEVSPLYEIRKKNKWLPVIGEGSHDARVMFVGEAPGKNEAEQGRPFCGAAGRVLDELLNSAGLDRKDVYVTNNVKDRHPQNRDPEPGEIEIYAPFLDRQINIIQPEVIIGLGRFSSKYIMDQFGLGEMFTTIGAVHGKAFDVKTEYGNIKIVPMYHPAAALYGAENKKNLEEDFRNIKKTLEQ
ncbi:MAG: uracil-DNA glycosylase [Candidatus Spechtbacterales bacterium]